MYNDATLEQVRLLAKQLKVPTFVQYPDLLRQAGYDLDPEIMTPEACAEAVAKLFQ